MDTDDEDVFAVKTLKRVKTSRTSHDDTKSKKTGTVRSTVKFKVQKVAEKGATILAMATSTPLGTGEKQDSKTSIYNHIDTNNSKCIDLTQDSNNSWVHKDTESLRQSQITFRIQSVSDDTEFFASERDTGVQHQTATSLQVTKHPESFSDIPAMSSTGVPSQKFKSVKRLSLNKSASSPAALKKPCTRFTVSAVSNPTTLASSSAVQPSQSTVEEMSGTDLAGRCPFCQMPFRALSGQSPNWHTMECMDVPLKVTEECPAELDCDSTIPSHYRRYAHSLIALHLAGTSEQTTTDQDHVSDTHPSPEVNGFSSSAGFYHEQSQGSSSSDLDLPEISSPKGIKTLTLPNKRNSGVKRPSSSQDVSSQENKRRPRKSARIGFPQKSVKTDGNSQKPNSSQSSQKSNSSIKDYFPSSPGGKVKKGENCTYDCLDTSKKANDDLPADFDPLLRLMIMSNSDSEEEEKDMDKKVSNSDKGDGEKEKVNNIEAESFYVLDSDDDFSDNIEKCEESSARIDRNENLQNHLEGSSINNVKNSDVSVVTTSGYSSIDQSSKSVKPVTGIQTSTSSATDISTNTKVNPLLQKQTSLFSYFAPQCHSAGISKQNQNTNKNYGESLGKKQPLSKPRSRKNGAFKAAIASSSAESSGLSTKLPLKGGAFKAAVTSSSSESSSSTTKLLLVASSSEPVISIRVPSPPPDILQNKISSPHTGFTSRIAGLAKGASSFLSSTTNFLKNATRSSSNGNPQSWGGRQSTSGETTAAGWKGRNRQCPFYKKLPGTAITVDAFRYGAIPGCDAYVLTHFHSDHYQGLSKNFSQPIYCSNVTANLVEKQLRVPGRWVNRLPMNTPTQVAGVWLTLMEANHCPGAVIILFELANGRKLLHTGDFRADPCMEQYPPLVNVAVDELYLDTTYCDPSHAFPRQKDAIEFAVSTALKSVEQNPAILVVCGAYTIGKERIFLALADALQSKICVQPIKKRVLDCLEDSRLKNRLSLKWTDGRVHVLPMGKLNAKGLGEHLEQCPQFSSVLAFEPTGWTHSNKAISLDSLRPKFSRNGITVYGVPYSEHSSYLEMKRFVQFLRPKKILPTVNNGNPASRKKMENIFNQWMSEVSSDSERHPAVPPPVQQSLGAWLHK